MGACTQQAKQLPVMDQGFVLQKLLHLGKEEDDLQKKGRDSC
jgi:hypothetical protein